VNDGGRSILANSVYRAVAEVGSKVASLVLYAVMAREIGADGFGVFTFGLAFVTLITALGSFGQDGILTREVARDQRRIHSYFANTLALKTLLAAPALSAATAGAWFLGTPSETTAVIFLLGATVVIEQYMSTCFGALQAHDRVDLIAVVLLSQRIVTAFVGVVALLLGADVILVSAVYLGGAGFGLAFAFVLLVRRIVRPNADLEPRSWWPLMRVAVPLGIATIFGTILFRADIAILALFEPDAVVGHYGAAFRLFESTLFISWSVGTATYAVFSRLHSTSDPPVAPVFGRALKLLVATTLPLALGAAVLAEPTITLFYGSQFEDGATALALLAPAIALFPLAHLAAVLLVAQDRQVAVAAVYAVVAVQNVVGSFVLIPLFSLEGAAVEASLTQFLLTVAFLALAVRTVGRLDWPRISAGAMVAAAAAALIMLTLVRFPLPGAVLAAIAYVSLLIVFERHVYPADARALSGFIRLPGAPVKARPARPPNE
jgi:O-antigen/teichoic acid export membrane protein